MARALSKLVDTLVSPDQELPGFKNMRCRFRPQKYVAAPWESEYRSSFLTWCLSVTKSSEQGDATAEG